MPVDPEVVRTVPEVITAAAQSPLGLMALMVILLAGLSYLFFSKSSARVKGRIFLLLFAGVVAFGIAVARTFAGVAPQMEITYRDAASCDGDNAVAATSTVIDGTILQNLALANGVTATATSFHSQFHSPQKAIDGGYKNCSSWIASTDNVGRPSGGWPQAITVRLPRRAQVVAVAVSSAYSDAGYSDRAPTEFEILVGAGDGIPGPAVYKYVDGPLVRGRKVVNLDQPIEGSVVMVVVKASADGTAARVDEIEIFGRYR